jgi:hypothetical protein
MIGPPRLSNGETRMGYPLSLAVSTIHAFNKTHLLRRSCRRYLNLNGANIIGFRGVH